MPRGAPKAGVAPLPGEGFLRETPSPLTLDERVALRAIFASPLWAKVWKNALTAKPSVVVPDGRPEAIGVLANNRLAEMKGWEMFRVALEFQVQDKVAKTPPPKDTYPEGLQIVTPPKAPAKP